jgi:prepilin-type N-terminal cleavage/methylation domain-containing protein
MNRARAQGFTIVEVMIVLAVTGALFVSAALLISGRQNQTQFDQGIRQIQSQIQQTINDVSTGFYPSRDSFACSAAAGSLTISSGTNKQGTNSGCVFLGKVMQFKVHGTDPEQFATFSVAGLQKNGSGNDVSSLSEASPVAIAPGPSHANVPDITQKTTMQYGISAVSMKANGNDVGAVGFMSSLAQYSGGSVVSGSQQVNVIPVSTTALNTDTGTVADAIDARLASSPLDPSGGVQICFASGGTDQSGLITIGSSGRQLSVTLNIKGNKTCA